MKTKTYLRAEVLDHHLKNVVHLSRRQFSKLVPVCPGYFTHLMKGERCPSEDVCRRLMTVTGLEYHQLFRTIG